MMSNSDNTARSAVSAVERHNNRIAPALAPIIQDLIPALLWNMSDNKGPLAKQLIKTGRISGLAL